MGVSQNFRSQKVEKERITFFLVGLEIWRSHKFSLQSITVIELCCDCSLSCGILGRRGQAQVLETYQTGLFCRPCVYRKNTGLSSA